MKSDFKHKWDFSAIPQHTLNSTCQRFQKSVGVRTQEKQTAARAVTQINYSTGNPAAVSITLRTDTPNYVRERKSYLKGYQLFFVNTSNLPLGFFFDELMTRAAGGKSVSAVKRELGKVRNYIA